MEIKKILEKLEIDLSAFLINEIPKDAMTDFERYRKIYLYKGLNISATSQNISSKTISVRIGALEAEYKFDTTERVSGGLVPDDDHLIRVWLSKSKESPYFAELFSFEDDEPKEIKPIDFDDL